LSRFAYAVLAGEQLVAVSNAIKFRYDDGTTLLEWKTGLETDNAIWITVFLVLVVIFNMFPVRVCDT
jgi:amino acid transporter